MEQMEEMARQQMEMEGYGEDEEGIDEEEGEEGEEGEYYEEGDEDGEEYEG